MHLTSEVMYYVIFVISIFGIHGKPSYSFDFPSVGRLLSFGDQRDQRMTLKTYSGKRVKNDSIRMIYIHDQTVAIVELEPTKLLLNCELIEVFEPDMAPKVVGELEHVSKPVSVSFKEMWKLMKQCKELEETEIEKHGERSKNKKNVNIAARGLLSNNPFTLISGIIPGTKWCGTGDIAKNYFDLGVDSEMDSCCRQHDLCPVKVRGYSNRYNLTNNSLYTKSHCVCDDALFNCLKSSNSPTANVLGNVYFNLVQVPCLEDTKHGRRFRKARNNF